MANQNPQDTHLATQHRSGWMSKADKAKLDAYPAYAASGLATPTAWVALPYAANWGDFGAGFSPGKYAKDAIGRVHVVGLVKKAAALALADTIATLPAGFRPATIKIFVVPSFSGAYTEIRIDTGGNIILNVGGSATWVGLDALEFETTV